MLSFTTTLKELEEKYLKREFPEYKSGLISFGSNDYLGLSQHPEVKIAAIDAIHQYGVGAGASRLISNHELYEKLEKKLAKLKDTESACVYGSGYLTSIGVIPTLVTKGDIVFADKLIHSCLLDGIKLSGARLFRFNHNNIKHLEKLLEQHRKKFNNALIITETVFSMDGDLAPLDEIYRIANKYRAYLITDDAHGLFSKSAPAHIKIGTLSKAIGAYGGYICGSKEFIDYLINKSRSLIYSTALPPAILAASIKAIDIIQSNRRLCELPIKKARIFLPKAKSQIVPVIIGNAKKTLKIQNDLKKEGFYIPAIRPPTVPSNSSRLRLSFTALHKDDDILRLKKCLENI